MRLNVECTPGEAVSLYVNGCLRLELIAGINLDRDDMMREIANARRLEAVPKILKDLQSRIRTIANLEDHVNASEGKKVAAFADGFRDGLALLTVPHGSPGVPDVLKNHAPAYRAGYEYGECLARIIRAVEESQ